MHLTLALSTHRVETLAPAEALMRGHQAVFLEEPRTPGFADMLGGTLSVDDYLLATDFEFPAYARASCELHRRLHAAGIVLAQVEPYLDELAAIHERFAAGEGPADIAPGSLARRVHAAEKEWTGRLLAYYQASANADFEALVEAVIAFARADAARGRLRDSLRAAAVAEAASGFASVCVEAGHLHHGLLIELRRALPGVRVRPVWLMEPEARRLTGRRAVLGPGDRLTLLLACRPGAGESARDAASLRLLAARSLVHVKIEHKEEAPPSAVPAAHLAAEAEAWRLTGNLTYAECREIFGKIRSLPTRHARRLLERRAEPLQA